MILSLKSTFALGLSFVLLGAVVVYGLKTTTLMEEADGGGIMVEATKSPLKLEMVFNKTTFEVGKIVNFMVTLENIGNETVTVCWGSPGSSPDYFSFIVYDKDGLKVYEPNSGWLDFYRPPMSLPPGLATIATIPWHQPYNLAPDTYHIVGLYRSHILNMTLETSPVEITLT
jgi:hypothetical protein